MKSTRGFVAICVCFLFLVSLVFVPSISHAQTEGATGGTAAGEGAAGAGSAQVQQQVPARPQVLEPARLQQ